jgi:hypothetical protein
MVCYFSFDGTVWHAPNGRTFPNPFAAIQYIQQLLGREGRVERISKDRFEVHFEGYSQFAPLAE